MAIELNDNISALAPKLLDRRESSNGIIPYSSVTEATTAVHKNFRARGLLAYIQVAGKLHLYWYRDGIEDSDLVRVRLQDFEGGDGPGGMLVHNSLVQLDGGDPANNQYYHLSKELYDKIIMLNNKSRTIYFTLEEVLAYGTGVEPFEDLLILAINEIDIERTHEESEIWVEIVFPVEGIFDKYFDEYFE